VARRQKFNGRQRNLGRIPSTLHSSCITVSTGLVLRDCIGRRRPREFVVHRLPSLFKRRNRWYNLPSDPLQSNQTMATTDSRSPSLSRSTYRRPKLLRSYVTAPTLVTSYTCHNDRTTPNFGISGVRSSPKDKAATLLNRVASYGCYSYSEKSPERRSPVASSDRSVSESPGSRREAGIKIGSGKSNKAQDDKKNGAYFSFPSFEEFEGGSDQEESDDRDEKSRRYTHR